MAIVAAAGILVVLDDNPVVAGNSPFVVAGTADAGIAVAGAVAAAVGRIPLVAVVEGDKYPALLVEGVLGWLDAGLLDPKLPALPSPVVVFRQLAIAPPVLILILGV